jgi:hypothetical protein
MPPRKPRSVAMNMDVISFTAIPGDLDWIHCPNCDGQVVLHQPDQQAPHRFLGFCEACKGWYLILVEAEITEAMMVVLPETGWFKALWDSPEFSESPDVTT